MAKTILITGGTGKVGTQLVNYFANKGLNVIFTSRTQSKLDALKSDRENVNGIIVNFLEDNSCDIIEEYIKNNKIEINYLVNNARDISALTVEENGHISKTNFVNEYIIDVVTPYELSYRLSHYSSLEKIINISSMYGLVASNPNLYDDFKPTIQYGCAKSALILLTKNLAVLLKDKGIKVNCVSYGGIEGRVDDNVKNRYAKLCPEGRMMKDFETIGVIDFLISKNSNYINGQNIIVDGGWTIW